MATDINRFTLLIGGEAGYGIMTAGETFSRAMMLGGLNIYTHVEYPSLIRGRHNSYVIRVEEEEVKAQISMLNLIIALNKETVDRHKHLLTAGGGIVYDSDDFEISKDEVRPDVKLYHVPMTQIINETEGAVKIMRNSIAIGASLGVVDYDFKLFEKAMIGAYLKKSKKSGLLQGNVDVAKKGYDYIKKNYPNDFEVKLEKRPIKKKMLLNGNQAIALGAIKAGCKFMSAYPMTPSTSIMNYFILNEEKAQVVMKQADDEIAAINMALGASFAGIRAMTATSGGGLALMSETVSLVGMSEVPLVIVDVQRPGPATGLPTRQGQADLKFVLNIGHGDFPRVVLAPGDMNECFHETFRAFNLADKYQIPVLILSDKHLAVSNSSLDPFDTKEMKIDRGWMLTDAEAKKYHDYKRFLVTDSGISPRAIPGQACMFRSSSDEHNEYGNIHEEPDNKIAQEEKRFRKLDTAMQDIPLPQVHGPEKADVTIVSWGSPKGAILEAMDYLKKDGISVNFLQLTYIYPFHTHYVMNFLKKAKLVIDVEENMSGQLAGIIREFTGFKIEHKILKYNGRSFFPSEIYDGVKGIYHG